MSTSAVQSDTAPQRRTIAANSERSDARSTLLWVLGLCLFETAYFVAYRYGMVFSQEAASPFWFPDSVLLCTLLLVRPRWWWIFLLATLPMRLFVAVPPGLPYWFLVSTFAIDGGKAVVSASLLRRLSSDPLRFASTRQFVQYCFVAVLLVPLAAAFAGAAARQAIGYGYWESWQQWFLGDATTALIITPIIFYWVLRPTSAREVFDGRWIEALVLGCGLLVTTMLAFGPESTRTALSDAREYAPAPFLFWAAIRFGMYGATGAVALLTSIAIFAAVHGQAPFTARSQTDLAQGVQDFLLLRAAPLYLVAVLVDQMRRVDRRLRESERRFRDMADMAPVLIWMSGPDKLCEFFNRGWLEFTGRTLEQERGRGWTEGVHAADLPQCQRTYESSFDARRPFEMDYRLRRRDGEYRWILDKGLPRYAADGTFLGYIGSAIDVSERRCQEVALRESEERYREVIESQTELVCRFHEDAGLTFVNGAFCRCFGRERDELLGCSLLSLMPEQARELIRKRLQLLTSMGGRCTWECQITLPDGAVRWQLWVCRGIFGHDDRVQELQATGMDVTDRKDAEEANRKLTHSARLAALGELTAMVAHEISQPLCAILSNAEAAETLLSSENPPLAEIRQILRDICKEDLRADEEIRRMRALMQKREIQLQPMDLNRTVEDVLRLVAGDALRRGVRISRELSSDLPQVSSDHLHLQQVLLNLITNGMDAMADTPESARQLTVQTVRKNAEAVQVSVFDRGEGIAPTKMPHLFDSFFTTKPNGMGIGLSIARSIIEAHRGRIWAENRPNGGAAFHFTVHAVCTLPELRQSTISTS